MLTTVNVATSHTGYEIRLRTDGQYRQRRLRGPTMTKLEKLRKLAIRPTPSQRFLECAHDGKPYFPFVDTGEYKPVSMSQLSVAAWEIFHRCTKEEIVLYLDTRRDQGFNAILTVLIPELESVTPPALPRLRVAK